MSTRVWSRDLVEGRREFTDVDTRPLVHNGRVFAGSASGGLFGLDLETGTPLWRAEVRGSGSPGLDGDDLLVPTSDGLLVRVSCKDGRIRYRVRLAQDGGIQALWRLGRWWTVSAPERGLLVVDPATGYPSQRIDPGAGVSAAPVSVGGVVVVLSDGGYLYGYRIARASAAAGRLVVVDRPG